jgi:hypothetical protein
LKYIWVFRVEKFFRMLNVVSENRTVGADIGAPQQG